MAIMATSIVFMHVYGICRQNLRHLCVWYSCHRRKGDLAPSLSSKGGLVTVFLGQLHPVVSIYTVQRRLELPSWNRLCNLSSRSGVVTFVSANFTHSRQVHSPPCCPILLWLDHHPRTPYICLSHRYSV
jgi:hypothetical protein